MKRLLVYLLLFLAACQSSELPPPTITRAPSLAPSATVLPFVLPESTDIAIGRSNPTDAALAAEGEPSSEPQITPLPTQAIIPLSIVTRDNRQLVGDLYGTSQRPAPVIVLALGPEDEASNFQFLASHLQNNGFHALLIRIEAEADLNATIQTLQSLPTISTLGILAEGRSTAASLAACQSANICRAAWLLRPEAVGEFSKALQTSPDWNTLLNTGLNDLLAWLALYLN